MEGVPAIDTGRTIDWGKTSDDYATFRPGPPASFYEKLIAHNIGLKDQRILDLATGTGVLAREFAKQGARVSGTDISPEQIAAARALAKKDQLNIRFEVSPAESAPFESGSFDVITANQCWLYFDKVKAIAEVKRLLAPGGVLMVSHFSWLPRLDAIAKKSEDLILKFNPQWSAANWPGTIPPIQNWAVDEFTMKGMFFYDEAIPFTRESWRGRIRACRGVGAALSQTEVDAFDAAHETLLQQIAEASFTILHRIDAHIYLPNEPL